MKKLYILLLILFNVLAGFPQMNYSGNGNTGFGDVIGNSNLNINDDGTTITFTITKGTGGFFDALVLYFDTGITGRTAIDSNVEDNADPLRRAISNGNDQGNGTIINFPAGFEASHAIGLDASFGGLWSIPAAGMVGDNGLIFIDSANSDLVDANQAICSVSIDWAELGLTGADSFDFVGLYLNAGNGFSSDEGYGDGIPSGNPGGGTITYSTFNSYSNTLSISDQSINTFTARLINDHLLITNYNGAVEIAVYDLLGKQLQQKNALVNGQLDIELNIPENQVCLIVIGSEIGRKVIRAISK